MEPLFHDYQRATQNCSGTILASTISPIAPPHYLNRLDAIYKSSDQASVHSHVSYGLTKITRNFKYPNPDISTWTEIYVAYWHAIGEMINTQDGILKPDWVKVYDAWKEVANTVIRGYSTGVLENWTLPVLYCAGKYLRIFAIKADESVKNAEGEANFKSDELEDDISADFGKNEKLEDAARVINRMFTLCISDRAPLEESRKWGLYYITNLLFKTYFKLNSIGLSKNILRALSASRTDMPELDSFPKSHIVTFNYYVGVISFLEEDYAAAEGRLTSAWHMCRHSANRNKELILMYLIPTRLLTSHTLPSARLLSPHPRLAALFNPLTTAIRSGSLSSFDNALAAGESSFVKRRIYLTLERGRDICLRNLLRKVYLAAGVDESGNRRTRIKAEEFAVAIRLGEAERGDDEDLGMGMGRYLDQDEVECLLANMIYKNLMKGYISRTTGIVVLSKTGAFPGTGI